MARRKREAEGEAGAPPWMATYSDLVTLLFCFFVLLYSLSNPDVQKFQALANSFSGRSDSIIEMAPSGSIFDMMGQGILEQPIVEEMSQQEIAERVDTVFEAMQEMTSMASDFQTYFADKNISDKVDVVVTDDSVKLTFGDGVLFDSGKADLKPEALSILELVADELLLYSENEIKIDGHTDNVPIYDPPRFPNNMYLSAARAISVMLYFTDTMSIDPRRISVQGWGEHRPVASNETPEGRSRNRRVEIKIMSKLLSSMGEE